MKYFEVTFTTSPCNETVNDIVSALAGEIGFESFVEWEGGVQAYIQQQLFDEEALKEMIANFPLPDTSITYIIKEAEKALLKRRNVVIAFLGAGDIGDKISFFINNKKDY